jgi:hypothetical protein
MLSFPRAKTQSLSVGAARCRRKFLHYFKGGFRDETYYDWERGYKERAHQQWLALLNRDKFKRLLTRPAEIAAHAVRIESRTNLLFSFEKMALRDAVKSAAGAKLFAHGLYDFLHGRGGDEDRFEKWCEVVARLPRRQTRVLTWPLVTVWGFIAQPDRHVFLKPMVTRRAAEAYDYDFAYRSTPSWPVYRNLLDFVETIRRDNRDLQPRDMIDLQSFLWVQGSDEYPD